MAMSASSLQSSYLDKISITVGDLQTSTLPLIYQTVFSDFKLKIGDNILSQNWLQKKLKANYFSDKNGFRYIYDFWHPSPPTHTQRLMPYASNYDYYISAEYMRSTTPFSSIHPMYAYMTKNKRPDVMFLQKKLNLFSYLLREQ